ncbi:protein kinase domain-containing protein [Streptomyces coelicoflavus]|uniref:serine/threonine-protein kinase n=1 Tax=Streptomyces coelicoflavus TaxID=285562 RepID=UPI0036B6D845
MQAYVPLRTGDPERVGPYRIVARLGSGGMGRVYLAGSPGGRATAVKVVHEELAEDPAFRRRFRREVAAAQRVSGPFTAPVVDADPDAELPWLATAHVPGVALGTAVAAHGAWPERSVRALGAGLAEALETIHRADVVHRDLKPSNVLLAPDGPRVIDFGISVAADDTKLTTTGAVVGSPGYLPPEQLVGREVGPPGDVFALGALLAYAATGSGPFGGGPAHGVGYRVVHEDPDLAGLPDGLVEVVARCLAKDPRQRPGVSELVGELGRWEADDGTGGTFTAGTWLPAPVAADIAALGAEPLPLPPSGVAAPADADLPTVRVGPVPTAVATARLGTPSAGPSSAARPRGAARRRTAVLAAAGAFVVLAVVGGLLLPRAFSDSSGPGDDAENSGSPTAAAKQLTVRELWPSDRELERPHVARGKLIGEGDDGRLHAVDTADGDLVWTYDSPESAAFEGVSDGLAVVSSNAQDTIQGVDVDGGERVWKVDARTHTPSGTEFNLYMGVVVADGTVYLNAMYDLPEGSKRSGTYAVSAVDAATGRLKWTHRIDQILSDALAVVDGVVYGGVRESDGTYFHAWDAETGDRLWRYRASASRNYGGEVSAIEVSDGTVYFGDDRGVLHAVDARRGTRRWIHDTDTGGVRQWLDPLVVADGVVYGGIGGVTSEYESGSVHAVDAGSGKPLWSEQTERDPELHGLLDGSVLFSTRAGDLRAADARTGATAKTRLSSGDPDAALDGDRIYFDGGDGRLHAGRVSLTER